MEIYSYSKLSTFEQCPLKFKFRYIEKLEPDIKQTIEGFLGNKVHEALEWIYNNLNKEIKLDDLIRVYIESWNKDYSSEIKIVNQEFDAEYYFNKGIQFLINYFIKNSPFLDNTIATEKKILINLDSEGEYRLQGYIDRLVHDREKNIFEIHDYKTGSAKNQEELDKDRQLAIYCIGIKQLFENVGDIKLVWHFLDINKEMYSRRTDEELEKLSEELISLINKIRSTRDFLPNPSCLCKWCEFRSYCPVCE
jgi:putative RecB family exonuclease